MFTYENKCKFDIKKCLSRSNILFSYNVKKYTDVSKVILCI